MASREQLLLCFIFFNKAVGHDARFMNSCHHGRTIALAEQHLKTCYTKTLHSLQGCNQSSIAHNIQFPWINTRRVKTLEGFRNKQTIVAIPFI